jgi:hypothetical protein
MRSQRKRTGPDSFTTNTALKKGRRIDIVVFGKRQVATIDDYRLRCEMKYVTPHFGFELGTESITDVGEHLESDVAKLHDQVLTRGYVIHFYRDTAFVDSDTNRRKATDESILRRFRQHVEQCQHDRTKIIILAFVLRVAHTRKRPRGICQILDRSHPKLWRTINIKEVEKLTRKILGPPSL